MAEKMTTALSDLAGVELPIVRHVHLIVTMVLVFIGARMVVETFTAHYYPMRLKVVHHEGELESSRIQILLSLAIQVAVFIFFAISILGSTWALYFGTAVFFTPLILGIFEEKIPKSHLVTRLKPNGVVTWAIIIVAGVLLASLLDHLVHNSSLVEAIGFIILPVPVLAFWTLELFEEEEEREEYEDAEDGDETPGHGDRSPSSHVETPPVEIAPADGGGLEEEGESNAALRKWAIRLGGMVLVILSVLLVNVHT